MPIITIAAKPTPTVVDPIPHVAALRALGDEIAPALGDLVVCRQSLLQMPPDAPFRALYEECWEMFATRIHQLLRTAYTHLALLCTVDPPVAWKFWEEATGPRLQWEQAGLTDLLAYWKGREAPSHHWNEADWRALDKARIPAEFDADLILTREATA
jgi:hypothetical protein